MTSVAPPFTHMAKATVVKGGWWWHGVERCVGDVLEASPLQVERWAADGLVAPMEEEETATSKVATETATKTRTARKGA